MQKQNKNQSVGYKLGSLLRDFILKIFGAKPKEEIVKEKLDSLKVLVEFDETKQEELEGKIYDTIESVSNVSSRYIQEDLVQDMTAEFHKINLNDNNFNNADYVKYELGNLEEKLKAYVQGSLEDNAGPFVKGNVPIKEDIDKSHRRGLMDLIKSFVKSVKQKAEQNAEQKAAHFIDQVKSEAKEGRSYIDEMMKNKNYNLYNDTKMPVPGHVNNSNPGKRQKKRGEGSVLGLDQ